MLYVYVFSHTLQQAVIVHRMWRHQPCRLFAYSNRHRCEPLSLLSEFEEFTDKAISQNVRLLGCVCNMCSQVYFQPSTCDCCV
jgi:hypothetical protein